MASRRGNWKVIAISGVTNGGKTTLANRLMKHFPGSVVMHQDEFYFASDDRRHVWVPLPGERRHQNWELVETVDWQAFEERIRNVISGPAAMASASAAAKPAAKHFLILDGHIILNHKPFRNLLDKRFFITLPRDVCERRRSGRCYDPPDPPGYFDAIVWPTYLSNKHAMEKMHDPGEIVYLDGTLTQDQMFQQVITELSFT